MIPYFNQIYSLNDLFCIGRNRHPVGKFSDKSKRLFGEPHRELKEFSIKGHKIMAYSRKDAITRLKHQKKI